LPVRFVVALDRDDVELGVRPDPDHGHRLAGVLPVRAGRTHLGVEHLGEELAEPGDVFGDPGDVIDAVKEHD